MLSGVHSKKLNTCGELELAANQAEPENQAEPVPGPDPLPKKLNFLFSKNLIHHYARSAHERTASTYVREKGVCQKIQ